MMEKQIPLTKYDWVQSDGLDNQLGSQRRYLRSNLKMCWSWVIFYFLVDKYWTTGLCCHAIILPGVNHDMKDGDPPVIA